MNLIRNILLIVDTQTMRSQALYRAEALAKAYGSRLWLVLFDRGASLGIWGALDREQALRLEAMMRQQESERLDELRAAVAERTGVEVERIDEPARASAQRIEELVEQHEIDLVIKDVGHESALRRLMFLPLDWELLRNSGIPVWLVGGDRADVVSSLPQRILAAVDPVHPEHGAGALNEALLSMAKTIAKASQGELRVCSAFAGLPTGLPAIDPNGFAVGFSLDELYERLRVEHGQALKSLAQREDLPDSGVNALFGPVVDRVREAAEDFGADLLVVGSLRRKGMARLMMGSTVERLLGQADCDVLAVPRNAADDSAGE